MTTFDAFVVVFMVWQTACTCYLAWAIDQRVLKPR